MKAIKRLTSKQTERYERQLMVPLVGVRGMKKLLAAHVTVIGAGGLGCPACQVLSASGVGTIRIIDGDRVELSNLPRQFLHHTKDIGRYKVDSIREKLIAMNPEVTVEAMRSFVDKDNIKDILDGTDYVIAACDTLEAKYLINDACVHLGYPFTIAGVENFFAQILSVQPGQTRCLRCFFPYTGSPCREDGCIAIGVMGAGPGMAGMIQANEATKWILGAGTMLINRLLMFNLLDCSFNVLDIESVQPCSVCAHPKAPFYRKFDYI